MPSRYCHNHEGEKKRRPSQSVRLRMTSPRIPGVLSHRRLFLKEGEENARHRIHSVDSLLNTIYVNEFRVEDILCVNFPAFREMENVLLA